jgi:flagellar biosynthesis/type III secretory pathway protein FliH
MTGRKLSPLQRAYLLGLRRGLAKARKEMRIATERWEDELESLSDEVDALMADYATCKQIAQAVTERDPNALLH